MHLRKKEKGWGGGQRSEEHREQDGKGKREDMGEGKGKEDGKEGRKGKHVLVSHVCEPHMMTHNPYYNLRLSTIIEQ